MAETAVGNLVGSNPTPLNFFLVDHLFGWVVECKMVAERKGGGGQEGRRRGTGK